MQCQPRKGWKAHAHNGAHGHQASTQDISTRREGRWGYSSVIVVWCGFLADSETVTEY